MLGMVGQGVEPRGAARTGKERTTGDACRRVGCVNATSRDPGHGCRRDTRRNDTPEPRSVGKGGVDRLNKPSRQFEHRAGVKPGVGSVVEDARCPRREGEG